MPKKSPPPDRILSYFQAEGKVLAIITASGLVYNLGLLAGPWFEGRMAETLVRILQKSAIFSDMLVLVCGYIAVTAVVQGMRYVKRFYVRRFANNINRRMKETLYGNLVRKSRRELEQAGAGSVLTKAILDVDDCAEGMQKFTTEVFDTGVALAAYAGMLLWYDWRLALLCMVFPPISYFLAEKMKVVVQRTGAVYKEQSGILSAATMDRASNALTYRIFGREQDRQHAYERELESYENAAVKANIWSSSLPPIYKVISMAGAVFILYFGSRNVLGTGWRAWSIAEFTTFLACFTKLADKSSKAAKLFNAVHKAQVSWRRIKPLMQPVQPLPELPSRKAEPIRAEGLSFAYPGEATLFSGLSFTLRPGQIIGVTGPVACGKSTLGRVFLNEYPYGGQLRFGDRELKDLSPADRAGLVGYLGHDPELFNASIAENILLGSPADPEAYLRLVCLDREVAAMPDGTATRVGTGGVRLSGGQAQRLALARTLCHKRPLLVLDDPFSALDRSTEAEIFQKLRQAASDCTVVLISHRLYLFPQLDQVIWMESGRASVGTHQELLNTEPAYADLFRSQSEEADHAE